MPCSEIRELAHTEVHMWGVENGSTISDLPYLSPFYDCG